MKCSRILTIFCIIVNFWFIETKFLNLGTNQEQNISYRQSYSTATSRLPQIYSEMKNKSSLASNSLCSRDRNRKILCYCFSANSSRNGKVLKADCWIFQKNLYKYDPAWQDFNQQKSLKQIKFTIQPTGHLDYIPTECLEMLHNLTDIHIEYAQIPIVKGYAFGNLPNLEMITLTNNQIEVIAENAFVNHEILKQLHLQNNQISTIELYAFRNLPQLKKLYLNSNNISSLQDNLFSELNHLEEIDIGYNFLTIIRGNIFKGLGNLKSLRLTHNNLNFVGNTVFAELWSLQELHLDENIIERISQRALDGLNNLNIFNLRGNRLKTLDQGIFRTTPALFNIDLQDNLLETLTNSTFEPIIDNLLSSRSDILISSNSFFCDCRLQWLFDLQNKTKSLKIKKSLENAECKLVPSNSSPIDGLLVKSYHIESFDSNENMFHQLISNEFSADSAHVDNNDENIFELMRLKPENLPCSNQYDSTELPVPRKSLSSAREVQQYSDVGCRRWRYLPIAHLLTFSIFIVIFKNLVLI